MLLTSSTDVYLSLDGEVIPNHGYVEISGIGSSDTTALLCHTNRPANGANSGGDWFAPDGTPVGVVASTTVPGFGRNKGPMVVRLRRNSDTAPDEGIYWCTVSDAEDASQSVYVGLYNTGGGMYIYIASLPYLTYQWPLLSIALSTIFSGQIEISTRDPTSDLNGDSPQFTLTCISTGGPATTVTWTRDSTTIMEDIEPVLVDAVNAVYIHTLNVTAAGEYTCTVANSAFSASDDITLEGMIHTVSGSYFIIQCSTVCCRNLTSR